MKERDILQQMLDIAAENARKEAKRWRNRLMWLVILVTLFFIGVGFLLAKIF